MEDYLSGDIVLLVSGAAPYEISKLMSFLKKSRIPCEDNRDKFHVLINFSDARGYKSVIKRCDIPNPVRVPYGAGNNAKKDWLSLL